MNKIVCSKCGGTEFVYEEDHPSRRTMVSNDGNTLTFESDFEWFDGDSSPGAICADLACQGAPAGDYQEDFA